MTAHDGVTSDGRSSHSDRHSVIPSSPKSHTSAVAKFARQKLFWPGCLSACICSGDGWMDGLVLLLAGRITVAGAHRTCEAHIQLHFGRQARDDVIKVRQETTRADAISTAGPRVMAQTRS